MAPADKCLDDSMRPVCTSPPGIVQLELYYRERGGDLATRCALHCAGVEIGNVEADRFRRALDSYIAGRALVISASADRPSCGGDADRCWLESTFGRRRRGLVWRR